MDSRFIRRVRLINYKSIASCDVELPSLGFFVGPNGAGKSNFLDSFRFVSDSLQDSLDHALRARGGIKEVRRRSGGHPNHFAIRLDFDWGSEQYGHLSFRIGAKPKGGFEVQAEECFLSGLFESPHFYRVQKGEVIQASVELRPAVLPDRLFLVAASGLEQFRPVFSALSRMQVYNPDPNAIKALQKPDPGELLRRNGSNIASVFQNMDAEGKTLINAYLAEIVAGLKGAHTIVQRDHETIEFRQAVHGQNHPWNFSASSMSDGTLRAFGVLMAIFQYRGSDPIHPKLIGLEEPEMALHPAASSVLLKALRKASQQTQILVTSHSPELLDNPDIDGDSIFAVESREGSTIISHIDDAGRDAIREKLFTPGELLRMNQIAPQPTILKGRSRNLEPSLFDYKPK